MGVWPPTSPKYPNFQRHDLNRRDPKSKLWVQGNKRESTRSGSIIRRWMPPIWILEMEELLIFWPHMDRRWSYGRREFSSRMPFPGVGDPVHTEGFCLVQESHHLLGTPPLTRACNEGSWPKWGSRLRLMPRRKSHDALEGDGRSLVTRFVTGIASPGGRNTSGANPTPTATNATAALVRQGGATTSPTTGGLHVVGRRTWDGGRVTYVPVWFVLSLRSRASAGGCGASTRCDVDRSCRAPFNGQ